MMKKTYPWSLSGHGSSRRYLPSLIAAGVFGFALHAPAQTQLLAYWDFNADGSPESDISGNGIDLTLSAGASQTGDSQGFSETAGDRGLDTGAHNNQGHARTSPGPHFDEIPNGNAYTIVLWQKNRQVATNTSTFWMHAPGSSGNQRGIQAHIPWSNGTIYFDQSGCCAGGAERLTVGGRVLENEWQHFAFRRDAAGNRDIFVDGVSAASIGGAAVLEPFDGILTIGAEGPNGNNSFNGIIDEFGVFAGALSDDEIMMLADGTTIGDLFLEDSDGDGIVDVREQAIIDFDPNDAVTSVEHVMGTGAAPAVTDFDGDGISDGDEFDGGTDPTSDDTDGDGLKDGVETGTGTYVDENDTGTSPSNDDTDGDGLTDGAETNTGTFVDENDTGTDPLDADTDGDTYPDGSEVDAGSDPHDAGDSPSIPPPLVFYDFEEGGGDTLTDGTPNENNGIIERGVTFVQGAPDGATPTGGGRFESGLVQVPGIDAPADLAHRDSNPDGSYTLAAWMKPDASSIGGDKFFWGQTAQGIHNGLRGTGTLHTAHWGSDFNAATILTADEWIHAVWTYDGPTNEARIYLNGVLDGGPFNQNGPNGSGNLILGGRNGGGQNFNGCIDDVAVWQEVLDVGHIAALAAGAHPNDANLTDADGDEMTDFWETQNGLDPGDPADAGEDPDGDGLTNKEEHDLRTDPNNEDSDEDGLTDDVETGTGTWVSSSDTGTSPKSADSDGDGLPDGAETNTGSFASVNDTGTNPNESDTDGDEFPDGREIALGSDANDENSVPAVPVISVVGSGTASLLGGDLTDPEDDGDDRRDPLSPGDGLPERGWNFIEAVANEKSSFADHEAAFNIFDNKLGPGQDKWCCNARNITVVFEAAYSLTHFTMSSANDVPNRDWRVWRLLGSNDGDNFDLIYEHEGLDVDGNEGRLWTERLQVIRFDLPRATRPYTHFRLEADSNWGDNLWQLGEVELFGTQGKQRFFFDVESDGDNLVLTWESKGGELYNLRSETDPSVGGEEGPVTWPIYDGNEDIEATPPLNTLTIPRPADDSRFFVIESFPAPPESVFSDDFESGQGEWTVGSAGEAGTAWELGVPGAPGPTEANSPTNCFGTNLTGSYGLNADVWLRSPAIDLSGAGGATLNFAEFKDIEEGFDFGTISVLDAADDSVLAVIDDAVDGFGPDWEIVRKPIPAEGLGRTIKIEFRLNSDELENFAGWYIDDVNVTVP